MVSRNYEKKNVTFVVVVILVKIVMIFRQSWQAMKRF